MNVGNKSISIQKVLSRSVLHNVKQWGTDLFIYLEILMEPTDLSFA